MACLKSSIKCQLKDQLEGKIIQTFGWLLICQVDESITKWLHFINFSQWARKVRRWRFLSFWSNLARPNKVPLFLENSPVAMRMFVAKAVALSLPIELTGSSAVTEASKSLAPGCPVFCPDFISYVLGIHRAYYGFPKHSHSLGRVKCPFIAYFRAREEDRRMLQKAKQSWIHSEGPTVIRCQYFGQLQRRECGLLCNAKSCSLARWVHSFLPFLLLIPLLLPSFQPVSPNWMRG